MSTALASQPNNDLGLNVFLTAYDPSDLPGGSVDPLGFERGYLFLAEKILPGLTNVADLPRYFAVLCAGAYLAEVSIGDSLRIQYQRRLDCVLRFERLWALANALASQQATDEAISVAGIRGVTYANGTAASMLRNDARRADANFKLLSRQVAYGAVGMYGAVADGMRLLDRKTFALTPDLGERLAEGFLHESNVPPALLKAVREGGDLPRAQLTEWGRRTNVYGKVFSTEQRCLHEALNRNPVRSRMARMLAVHPSKESDTELQRLKRFLPSLSSEEMNRDLYEAVSSILAYESCYRLVLLGFERLLWLCRKLPSIDPADLSFDEVLSLVRKQLPTEVQKLAKILETSQTEEFRLDIQRLEDTRRFLERVAASCGSVKSLTHELMSRHDDVQRGKLDRGRRKMPWLETGAGRISLTLTRVGGLDREAKTSTDIKPHPYRLSSADALISAARAR